MSSDVNFPSLPAIELLFVQPIRCHATISDVNFPALPAMKLLFVQAIRCYAMATRVKFPAFASLCRSWLDCRFVKVFRSHFLFYLFYFADQR